MEYKEWLNSIKDLVSIEDVLGYLDIKYSGAQMLCPNPDHNDRHLGSCTFDLQKGTYKCWACGDSGDIFSLVEKRCSCSFNEAVDYVINNYNSSHSVKIEKKYRKEHNSFPFSKKDLESIGIRSRVTIPFTTAETSYKPKDKVLKDLSEPGEYVSGDTENSSFIEVVNVCPELAMTIIRTRLQASYTEVCSMYASRFWEKDFNLGNKKALLDQKHALEDRMLTIKRMCQQLGADWVFPEMVDDPKISTLKFDFSKM